MKKVVCWIVPHENKTLVVQRAGEDMHMLWTFPSWKIEESDGSEEKATEREVFQETGVRVKAVRKLWERIIEATWRPIAYRLCEYQSGAINTTPNKEIAKVQWATKNDLLELITTDIYAPVQEHLEKNLI